MVSIKFLIHLLSCYEQLSCINNNTSISEVWFCLIIYWFVLATHVSSAESSHSSERNTCRVKQMICFTLMLNRNIARLGVFFWDYLVDTSIQKLIWERVDSVTNCRIKRLPCVFRFWYKAFSLVIHPFFPFIFDCVISLYPINFVKRRKLICFMSIGFCNSTTWSVTWKIESLHAN